jgi:hypothetical protein
LHNGDRGRLKLAHRPRKIVVPQRLLRQIEPSRPALLDRSPAKFVSGFAPTVIAHRGPRAYAPTYYCLFYFINRPCPSVQIRGGGIARRPPGYESPVRRGHVLPDESEDNGARLTRYGRQTFLQLLDGNSGRRLSIRFRISRYGSGLSEQPPVPALSSRRWRRVCVQREGLGVKMSVLSVGP